MRTLAIVAPDNGCVSCYRLLWPARHCAAECARRGVRLVTSAVIELDPTIDGYVLAQLPEDLAHLTLLRRMGKRLIWIVDDDLWNWPGSLRPRSVLNELRFHLADRIWVTNAELARLVRRPDITTTLPNLVPPGFWPAPRPRAPGPLRLLWSGSTLQREDFGLAVPVLERVAAELWPAVQVYHLGPDPVPQWTHHPRIVQHGCLEFGDYFRYLDRLQPDLAVIPRVDRQFNRCKSGLKYLEMAAVGAAVIASDLPAYREAIAPGAGLLVDEDAGAWFGAIRQLVEDDALRQDLAVAGRAHVLAAHSWSNAAALGRWADAMVEAVA